MRRILKQKTEDKSAAKKKRDALMSSITAEGQNKTRLIKEQEELSTDIIGLQTVHKHEMGKVTEVRGKRQDEEKKLKGVQEKLIPLQSELAEVEVALRNKKSEVVKARADLDGVLKKSQEEHLSLLDINDQTLSKRKREIREAEKTLTNRKSELSILTQEEGRVVDAIQNKKSETISLEKTLKLRASELSDMEKERKEAEDNIFLTKEKLVKANDDLNSADASLVEKNSELQIKEAEVKNKEKEVETKRNMLVALVQKEDRINELIPEIKSIYAKAGINIKI